MGVLAQLLKDRALNSEELLTDQEAIAFSIIESHIGEQYDTHQLFDSEKKHKGIPIAQWVVSLVLHQLYSKSEYMTPDTVRLNYVATMKDLQLIKTGKQALELPEKDEIPGHWELDHEIPEDDLDFDSPFYWGI